MKLIRAVACWMTALTFYHDLSLKNTIMLLALFVTVLLIYSLNFMRPDDRITRKEYDEALRHLKTKTELVYKDELKIVSKDNRHVALFESERRDLILKAEREIAINRKEWIDELNRLHDSGYLSDKEFDNEVNKWLDA
ncbi:hypothetical protein DR864_00310 [Runella rosea]|uniref:SHOCT domain-containing protein n=2 Tax=Runella rosea TaxID=2259595 RepID=A0A344TC48_9BACT|nr:hypothetical protein DR864_00030 [Runella rosea]AXE16275.1 hypothetical protein DR864_00310 [Runella rosea]